MALIDAAKIKNGNTMKAATHSATTLHILSYIFLSVFFMASATAKEDFSIYFIGNSLTDNSNPQGLRAWSRAIYPGYTSGRHMIPGSPMGWIYNNPESGFSEPPYGRYPQALPNYHWDIVTMQPNGWTVKQESDVGKAFLDLARQKNPAAKAYVYSGWPILNQLKGKSWQEHWLQMQPVFPDGVDLAVNYTKTTIENVVLRMRSLYNDDSAVYLIPNGHVLSVFHDLISAGKVPGVTSFTAAFYTDDDHLNATGSYLAGCTVYATIHRRSPVGLPADPYGVDANDPLIQMIPHVAWQVVTSMSGMTGVDSAVAWKAALPAATEHQEYHSYFKPSGKLRARDQELEKVGCVMTAGSLLKKSNDP